MKLQSLYREYKRLSEITNKYEEMIENEYTEEIENEFDKAYRAEHKAFLSLIDEIKELTKVDTKTARAMIANDRFAELMRLTIA